MVEGLAQGVLHSDPVVREEVRRVARYQLSRWWNRIPGWTLPLASVLLASVCVGLAFQLHEPLLNGIALFCVVPFVMGLGGWYSRTIMQRIDRLYG